METVLAAKLLSPMINGVDGGSVGFEMLGKKAAGE